MRRYIVLFICCWSLLSVDAQHDSITISRQDWQSLIERVSRLEERAANDTLHVTIPMNRDKRADVHTGATPPTDTYSGATRPTDARTGATRHISPKDSTRQVSRAHGLSVGGYAEATYKRAFYSNNYQRYMYPENYKNDGFGEFDLPHVCFWIGYEFGRGWSLGSEIEFEHGGTESAVEIEEEEGGEYEAEVERGGEVALEQLWIQKSFNPYANIRAGMIIVPIGGTNAHHEPNRFFGVYRPEGENTILPCTWHQIGLQFHGRVKWFAYTAQFLPGLESDLFGSKSWIHYGASSPYEFTLANTYAGALRLDFFPLSNKGSDALRISLSGYAGTSFKNYLKEDLNKITSNPQNKYYGVKGLVSLGSIDWCYNDHYVLFRGSATYGHLGDAEQISKFNKSQSKNSVSKKQNVASDAYAAGAELGYEFFHFNQKLKQQNQQFYVFARYDIYDSEAAIPTVRSYWCGRQKISGGINYLPIPQVIIKAEFGYGIINKNPAATVPYNNEPYVAMSVNYVGMFKW